MIHVRYVKLVTTEQNAFSSKQGLRTLYEVTGMN